LEKNINIVNRKARHEYFIDESFTAGISLTGSEVKSIRQGNVNMSEAYCVFLGTELWVKNMHISEFKQGGNQYNHPPLRDRKLLLTKRELRKIKTKSDEVGVTIIPLRFLSSDTGYAKLEIGIARGKKMFDKREDIKKRDVEREIKRFV
jgi:SsrA-binding protein